MKVENHDFGIEKFVIYYDIDELKQKASEALGLPVDHEVVGRLVSEHLRKADDTIKSIFTTKSEAGFAYFRARVDEMRRERDENIKSKYKVNWEKKSE